MEAFQWLLVISWFKLKWAIKFSLQSNFAKCSVWTKSEPNKLRVCMTPQEQSGTSGINFTLNWMFLPALTGLRSTQHHISTSFPPDACRWPLSAASNRQCQWSICVLSRVTPLPLIMPDITASQHPCLPRHGQQWPGLSLVSESESWPLIGW